MKYIKKLNIDFDQWDDLENDKWIKPIKKLPINTQVLVTIPPKTKIINFNNKKLIGKIVGYYENWIRPIYLISFKNLPGRYMYTDDNILIKKY